VGVTSEPHQADLFNNVDDVDLIRWLLADLHDDLSGKALKASIRAAVALTQKNG
jgi:hypothetical protein